MGGRVPIPAAHRRSPLVRPGDHGPGCGVDGRDAVAAGSIRSGHLAAMVEVVHPAREDGRSWRPRRASLPLLF